MQNLSQYSRHLPAHILVDNDGYSFYYGLFWGWDCLGIGLLKCWVITVYIYINKIVVNIMGIKKSNKSQLKYKTGRWTRA